MVNPQAQCCGHLNSVRVPVHSQTFLQLPSTNPNFQLKVHHSLRVTVQFAPSNTRDLNIQKSEPSLLCLHRSILRKKRGIFTISSQSHNVNSLPHKICQHVFLGPLGPPAPVGQGNAPPANPPNAPNPAAQHPAAGFNALGFQPAGPVFPPPPANNPANNGLGLNAFAPNSQPPANIPANNALGMNAFNPGPQPQAGNQANNGLGMNAFNSGPQVPASLFGMNHLNQGGPPPQGAGNDSDDDSVEDSDDEDPDNRDVDEQEELSPIALRIACPIVVVGNNNVVAIDAAKIATQIAKVMVKTLQDLAAGCSGVPMIDQDGRPRPVECRVDCKVKVNGNKNTVGEKAVLAMIPPQIRTAMVQGTLPVTPLSPTEDTLMEEMINRNRKALGHAVKKEEREAKDDEDGLMDDAAKASRKRAHGP
ncbi:uncharacterized protein PAC_10813 [Phialocephala subalpina]|uniref:Uncharacterized protein n=1 Tax=Phialocephala subalpina TaxID=576137 RepID=A0A1L7X7E3_9HELO|nr:uncharacterized protein PAC_10813 [Phialocephala subalpina]